MSESDFGELDEKIENLLRRSRRHLYAPLAEEYNDVYFSRVMHGMFTGVVSKRTASTTVAHYIFIRNLIENRMRRTFQLRLVDAVRSYHVWYEREDQNDKDESKRLSKALYEILTAIAPQGWLLSDGRFMECAYAGHTGDGEKLEQSGIDLSAAIKFQLGAPSKTITSCTPKQNFFIQAFLARFSEDIVHARSVWFDDLSS